MLAEIAPGVSQRASVPMPRGVARSHAYVVGTTLVEPASNLWPERDEWIAWGKANGIERVLATHWHADHTAMLREIADGIGVSLCGPAPPSVDASAPANPVPVVDEVLREGNRVGPWEVLETPGHDDAHLCLWDGRTLILGDADKQGTGDPHEWVRSLRRLIALGPELALPAHGRVYREHSFAPAARYRLEGC